MDKKEILIESAKYIAEHCGEHDVCDESCVFCTNHGYAVCLFGIAPCDWDFKTIEEN